MHSFTNGNYGGRYRHGYKQRESRRDDPPLGTYIIPVSASNVDECCHEPDHRQRNGISGPSQQEYHSAEPRVMNHSNGKPATKLEIKSKEYRTLEKHAPLDI
ncbi:hypothetical protein COOONC_04081 [Cooperia oncophora]